MTKRIYFSFLLILISGHLLLAQKNKTYPLSSPDGKIKVTVDVKESIQWSIEQNSEKVLLPSAISMTLANGKLGGAAKIISSKVEKVNTTFAAINYKKSVVKDEYNQLTLKCKGDYSLIFRAYNDGVAYRFVTSKKDSSTVLSEEANFNFSGDHLAYIPYANDPHNKDVYEISFENNYQHIRLSEMVKDTLAFAPVLIELPSGKKVVLTEADLEEYPGIFLQPGAAPNSLHGKFAPYPTEEKQGGHNNLQSFVMKRANYLAKTAGTKNFPWRVVIISESDKDLLNSDMIQKLAAPSRLSDISWIKPGKVAWDWWNDWNISHVDFRAGINTATYKYYIDFASSNHIENILLDEGWADSRDILKIVPAIDLKEIIDYGQQKNVGVWLWCGWLPLDKKMDLALSTFSKLGVKGLKVDFMDRDDQKMVAFYYRLAKKAADYKLMLDLHGAYKPTGLQRTYPNIVNIEGVRGMENTKWSNTDFPLYDCTIPFIRMVAGPMDYTPGAMKNANKANFRAINSAPMSQGTRCHQLAMYIVFESPFEMLADNPTNYLREPESTHFMASIPTTFDETTAIDGKVGEFVAIARKKNASWYVGVMSNWNSRDLTIDFSFLGDGNYEAEIFQDGVNADREATDYNRKIMKLTSKDKQVIHLSNGGGWAARIYPARTKVN